MASLKNSHVLMLVYVFLLTSSAASAAAQLADPWAEGAERPKMFVDYLRGPLKGEVQRFSGNLSAVDNFKIMVQDENFLLVGATNIVYFVDTRTMKEASALRLTWEPDAQAKEMCSVKGKSKAECQNHIRIVAKLGKQLLLICGTHAYRPKCRHYRFKEGHYVMEKEFEGIGLTPYDPYHNSSFVVADNELYTATVSDFSASDPLIYKEPLRTEQSNSKQLNSPDFVKTLADGDYVYFFFREQAVEFINCGKSVYSRVARVCKSDQGGPNKYRTSWTTFLKSRLNCSLPGEYPFYFDHLQSASDIVDGDYGGQPSRLIYAVFTTPSNSIAGNAICAFRIRDLLDTFEGPFKEQETANSNWLPVPKIKEPSPRPGRCSDDSKSLPETTLAFVKGHSIMDEAVPAFFGRKPIFVRASIQHSSKFRALAVDPQVQTPDGHTYDVLFVGTDQGRVLKIVNTIDPSNKLSNPEPTLVEEMVVFPAGQVVRDIKVIRNSLEKGAKLIILGADQVVAIPLARCSAVVGSCARCVALQDPYCAWDENRGQCIDLRFRSQMNSLGLVQSVLTGAHRSCSEQDVLELEREMLENTSPKEEPSSRVLLKSPQDEESSMSEEDEVSIEVLSDDLSEVVTSPSHYSAEELSMAVATSCVCALVLGFITGFLMARKCSCSRDEDENPYHVPYLNQSGYQNDDQIYAKVDDMTYYPVNSNLLVSLPNTNSTNMSSGSKTLNFGHHQPRTLSGLPGAFSQAPNAPNEFGTVHRSQKIYL